MNRLRIADQLVQLVKTAGYLEEGAGILDTAAKGVSSVIRSGATAAGSQAAQHLGGVTGKLVGGVIKNAPALGVAGTGIYFGNKWMGDPIGRSIAAKKMELAGKLQQQAAMYGGGY